MAMLNAQVTVIQKCYRGSRVMDWRNLRMNHIARHVYARRDFEQAQRALNRQKKFEITFKDGEKVSSREWNEDGSVRGRNDGND